MVLKKTFLIYQQTLDIYFMCLPKFCHVIFMQMLTMLEGAIKRDYLSSNFETTTELLNSNTQDTNQNSVARSGSVTVLPWVPDTTAAVALRLLDLDSSISYTFHPKAASNKDREAGDFTVSLICCYYCI